MRAKHVYVGALRYHVTPAGDFPGVTTVLGSTQDPFKSIALRKWRERIGAEEADKIMKDACTRGNFVHAAIEDQFEGKAPVLNSGTEDTDLLIAAFLEYASKIKYNKIRIEDAMFSKYKFAGSADLIALTDEGLVLYDWKTATKRKTPSMFKDYFLQLSAYSQMCLEKFGRPVQKAIIVMGHVEEGHAIIREFTLNKEEIKEKFEEFKVRLQLFYGDDYDF